MRNSARSFKEFYEASFRDEVNQTQAKKLSGEFLADFISDVPVKLDMLESYLSAGQFDRFYLALSDLKYLIEFSDDLSRYWHVLRGYSGALTKLKADHTVKGSKKIYSYYFGRYGDRRILRKEHWFEKKRWEFLDELQGIYQENELDRFMQKYQHELAENLKIYISFMMLLIMDLKKLTETNEVPEKNNSQLFLDKSSSE